LSNYVNNNSVCLIALCNCWLMTQFTATADNNPDAESILVGRCGARWLSLRGSWSWSCWTMVHDVESTDVYCTRTSLTRSLTPSDVIFCRIAKRGVFEKCSCVRQTLEQSLYSTHRWRTVGKGNMASADQRAEWIAVVINHSWGWSFTVACL